MVCAIPSYYLTDARLMWPGHVNAISPEGRQSHVCVLNLKAFFLPVDIQHTQCPRSFFILKRHKFYGHKATIQAALVLDVIVFFFLFLFQVLRRMGKNKA